MRARPRSQRSPPSPRAAAPPAAPPPASARGDCRRWRWPLGLAVKGSLPPPIWCASPLPASLLALCFRHPAAQAAKVNSSTFAAAVRVLAVLCAQVHGLHGLHVGSTNHGLGAPVQYRPFLLLRSILEPLGCS